MDRLDPAMILTATFDGEHVRLYVGRHRLRILWTVAGTLLAVVAWDWQRGW